MFSLHRTLGFRYIRQRWPRALLVVASIALGVATLVATRTLNQGMGRAARGAATPLAGAELMLSNGDSGVPLGLAEKVREAHVPGIKVVRPLVIGRVGLPDLEDRQAVVLGIEQSESGKGDEDAGIALEITNGKALFSGKKVAFVGRELAGRLPGGIEHIRIRRAAGKESELAGLGTVDAHGPAAMLGGDVLVLKLEDAAELVLGKPNLATRIDLTLTPGADRDEVRRRVAALAGDRAEVRTPEANDQAVRDVMAGLELGFLLGGLGALVVGVFLVYNALSVTVAERHHDIGILRSVGATRSQVASLFASEAAVLGLAGAALGVPLGYGVALLANGPLQRVLNDIMLPMGENGLTLTTDTIVGALVAGVVTALLAAVVPALRAASQEPADAVRRVPPRHGWRWRVAQVGGCGLVIALGIAAIASRSVLPPRAGSFGGIALVLIGSLASAPLLAEVAAQVVSPVARRFLRVEARLAADNLARSPGRTGLVIAALAAGVALLLETAGLTVSTEVALLDWLDVALAADLFVTGADPPAGGSSQPIDESLAQDIAALPEVAIVLPVRFRHPNFRDTRILMIALDVIGTGSVPDHRPDIRLQEILPRLREPGSVVISENFAVLHKVGVGDTITLRGPDGPVALRVTGIVVDYSWNRGTVYIARGHYRALFHDPLVDAFDVYLRPGADLDTVRETVSRRWGAQHSLMTLTRPELRDLVSSLLRRMYALAYAQEGVVGLVAALGVVTALMISVLQRRRELGLLRAVGASRGQVLRSVLAEAILMGLFGAALGILIGVPLEWYAVRVILQEETGFTFAVRVPWAAAGVVAGATIAVATLAGLGPAVHAMRLRIPEAIAYE